MDSIIWAFRHTERNIAETGLNLLLEMLKKFQASKSCNQFCRTYFFTIEQEIFAVLTDTFHKPGFKLHVLVLQHLFCLLETGVLTKPLWDAATNPYPYSSNAVFVREFTIKLLSTSFPNMIAAEFGSTVTPHKLATMPLYGVCPTPFHEILHNTLDCDHLIGWDEVTRIYGNASIPWCIIITSKHWFHRPKGFS